MRPPRSVRSADEAAKIIGVSVAQVNEWVKDGTLTLTIMGTFVVWQVMFQRMLTNFHTLLDKRDRLMTA